MAMSTCPKCEGQRFEIKTAEPAYSKYKLNFLQCMACGAVVGVLEFYNAGQLLKEQEKEIAKLQRAVGTVQNSVHTINNNLAVLGRRIKAM